MEYFVIGFLVGGLVGWFFNWGSSMAEETYMEMFSLIEQQQNLIRKLYASLKQANREDNL